MIDLAFARGESLPGALVLVSAAVSQPAPRTASETTSAAHFINVMFFIVFMMVHLLPAGMDDF